jgi:cardiolipin synthase
MGTLCAALNFCEMPRWFNVANCFTLLRLVLVPFVVLAILDGRSQRAITLFALAAVTDVLDGAAARHLKLATQTGAYLDPIADKCLLSGVFLALAAVQTVPWWFVAVVFGRDLYLVTAAGMMMALTRIRKFPPSVWGKASTFVQITAAVVWMAKGVLGYGFLDGLAAAMLWAATLFTILSGVHYTWRGIQVLRAH